MARSGNGVEVRNTSIRLAFTSQRRVACRETIYKGREPLAPTPPNVRYAHRVAEEIRRQLRAGHSGKVLLEVYSRWLPGADGAGGSSFWETGREESRMKFEVQRVEYPTPKVKFLVEVDLAEVAGMRLDAFDRRLLEDVGSDANATPADLLLLLEMLFRRRQEERKVG